MITAKITVVHFQNYKADLEISRTEQYTLTLEVLLHLCPQRQQVTIYIGGSKEEN